MRRSCPPRPYRPRGAPAAQLVGGRRVPGVLPPAPVASCAPPVLAAPLLVLVRFAALPVLLPAPVASRARGRPCVAPAAPFAGRLRPGVAPPAVPAAVPSFPARVGSPADAGAVPLAPGRARGHGRVPRPCRRRFASAAPLAGRRRPHVALRAVPAAVSPLPANAGAPDRVGAGGRLLRPARAPPFAAYAPAAIPSTTGLCSFSSRRRCPRGRRALLSWPPLWRARWHCCRPREKRSALLRPSLERTIFYAARPCCKKSMVAASQRGMRLGRRPPPEWRGVAGNTLFPATPTSGGTRLPITTIKSPTGPRFLLDSCHALFGCKTLTRLPAKSSKSEKGERTGKDR